MDKVSIIIPIYKVEKYINQCLTSIVNQSYSNLEIILVDDGSPDNCPQICDEWAKKDERIKVIHKENGGLSDARNFGLDIATGEYFVFVDSDDYVHLDYIKILKDGIDMYNADLCIASHQRFAESVNIVELTPTYEVHNGLEGFNRILSWHKDYVVSWAKMFKSSIFKHLRFEKGRINEDSFYIIDIYNLTDKIVYTSSEVYYYRYNLEGIALAPFSAKNLDILVAAEIRDAFLVKTYPELINKSRKAILFLIIRLYLNAKKSKCKKEQKYLFKRYKFWYKTGIKTFSKRDKNRLKLFRFSPLVYGLYYGFARRIKCKK